MIANTINGQIKIFNSIPKLFELKPSSMRYDLKDSSVHYTDGFREIVVPTLEENQYTTVLYFDTDNDLYTYEVETYTEEEINLKDNEKEYTKYIQRVLIGKEKYLKLCGEFRLSRDKGDINQEFYELLEDTLEPVRTELFLGQFITAKRKLVAIGSTDITQEIYDRFFNSLSNSIEELY